MTTATATWHALDTLATDVYQTRPWADADCAMQPGDPTPLVCSVSNGLVLVPTVRRPHGIARVLFSPYGYPGLVRAVDGTLQLDELLPVLRRRIRAAGACALLVRLHPVHDADLPTGSWSDAAVVDHGETAAIDLRQGRDAAWSAVRSRTRSYIRRAARDGFTVRVNAWGSDFDGFRRAYDESMERAAAAPLYRLDDDYWQRLRLLEPDHLLLVTARDGAGEVAAGALVTHHERIANYHLGGTLTAYLDHHLLELVLWRAAEVLAGTADLLHLGGGLGASDDGLFQLKRGLGRSSHRYRTLRLVADRVAFCEMTGGVPPDVTAERFPPEPR